MSTAQLMLGAILLWAFAVQQGPPPAEKIDVPDGGVEVPMLDFGGRPVVEVTIHGKGPYRFILDTGASFTVIDDTIKEELGLSGEAGGAMHGGGGFTKLDELSVGRATLKGAMVSVEPLSRMFRMGDAPRGVLSAASFPGYLLTLDYPAKRVRIRKGELAAADSRRIFEYTAEQILPNVPVRVNGTEFRVHIDSGSPGSLTLASKFKDEIPLASKPVEVGRARTPGGEFPIWSAQPTGNIELGEFKLELAEVQFSDVNPIPGPPTGNIGYRVLKDFVVTMDSKNRRIRLDR
jgi:hypothetical protein